MESLDHFGVAVDFEKDIAFVSMLITAKDPKQAPVLVKIIGEVINFGNVIICAPCWPLQRLKTEHIEQQVSIVVKFKLFLLLLRRLSLVHSAKHKDFALVDKHGEVWDSDHWVTSRMDLLPHCVSDVVSDSVQIDAPYRVVNAHIEVLSTHYVEILTVRRAAHVASVLW